MPPSPSSPGGGPIWFRLLRPRWRRASVSVRIVAVALVALVLAGVAVSGRNEKKALRTEGTLDITVLAVGYGSAILVDTPDNQAILIDTAFVQTDRGRRNDAERTILPQIFAKQINQLDALVLTSRAPEHSAGVVSILKYIDVDHFFYPASAAALLGEGAPRLASSTSAPPPISSTASPAPPSSPRPSSPATSSTNPNYDGKPFLIEALGPAAGDEQAPLSLRISYGDFAMLIPSDLTLAQQKTFLANTPPEKLKADVVIAPSHGTAGLETITVGLPDDMDQQLADTTGALLKATEAEAVIFEFGNPRPVVGHEVQGSRQDPRRHPPRRRGRPAQGPQRRHRHRRRHPHHLRRHAPTTSTPSSAPPAAKPTSPRSSKSAGKSPSPPARRIAAQVPENRFPHCGKIFPIGGKLSPGRSAAICASMAAMRSSSARIRSSPPGVPLRAPARRGRPRPLSARTARTSTGTSPRVCAKRFSLHPAARGSSTTYGSGWRAAKASSTTFTSAGDANACIREARPRNSPGVCGPRSSSSHKIASSGVSTPSVSSRRCVYFTTRDPTPE